MSRRWVGLVMVSIPAAAALALGASEVGHLRHGYSIGVSLNGGASSATHIAFPLWRQLAQLAIGCGVVATVGLCFAGRAAAVPAAWLTFAVALGVGAYDVQQYGTMGSPTSAPGLGLLLILAVTASLRKTLGLAPSGT